MIPSRLRTRSASIIWIEPTRIVAGGSTHTTIALPEADALANILTALPPGPTTWVVEDLLAPAFLARDIIELPTPGETRDAFFNWKYLQTLGIQGDYAVQALAVDEDVWLLAGLPANARETWYAAAQKTGHHLTKLQPRWLWLYNRLAPDIHRPGMLLSLSPHSDDRFTGTLAAWGNTLTLLRQWHDAATPEVWMSERVLPSVAYLQREGRDPKDLWVWGAPEWPDCDELHYHRLKPGIPDREAY